MDTKNSFSHIFSSYDGGSYVDYEKVDGGEVAYFQDGDIDDFFDEKGYSQGNRSNLRSSEMTNRRLQLSDTNTDSIESFKSAKGDSLKYDYYH